MPRALDTAEYDRVLDALRDYWKIEYDFANRVGVASGALLAGGLAALFGVFYPDLTYPGIAGVAFFLLVLSAIGSLIACYTLG